MSDHATAINGNALAAVDLGSNSFHLLVAREEEGQVRALDSLRERVAIAEGLSSDHALSKEAEERALQCLLRFRERLAGVSPGRVRAVGTATLRKIRRSSTFWRAAEEALGVPIEVLPGREEARLVYLGVAHSVGDDSGRRLVVDIGGGSTECVLGERFESVHERSLSMGCVRWSLTYFPEGKITRKRMEHAELDARLQLEPIESQFRALGWQSCFGSSGTILAIGEILARQGWTGGEIDRRGLSKLTKALVTAGSADAVQLDGLKEERRPVLAGGLAVLRAVFAGLGITRMVTAKGALREGLLHDLLGRIHHEDVRENSVLAFAQRFGVDAEQASRVAATAGVLFDQAPAEWRLNEEDRLFLTWAAQLHEVGLSVSWLSYHKHGAYLIEHADLRGFSREYRDFLSALVRCHRRRVPTELLAALAGSFPRAVERASRLVLLLRLAVRLHRGRGAITLPAVQLGVAGSTVRLGFPPGFLAAHPLLRADVEDEATILGPLGFQLELS